MRRRSPYFFCAMMAATSAWCAVGGCGEPRGPLSVKSDDPTLKIPAIKEDVRNRNKRDEAQMVKDLNDEDPAVRFYAVEGLRRLTGNTFDYRYYDDEDARRPAIARWRHWLEQRSKK